MDQEKLISGIDSIMGGEFALSVKHIEFYGLDLDEYSLVLHGTLRLDPPKPPELKRLPDDVWKTLTQEGREIRLIVEAVAFPPDFDSEFDVFLASYGEER